MSLGAGIMLPMSGMSLSVAWPRTHDDVKRASFSSRRSVTARSSMGRGSFGPVKKIEREAL